MREKSIATNIIPSHTLGKGNTSSRQSLPLTSNPRSRLACINSVTAPRLNLLRNTSETAGLRVGHVCKYAPLPLALVSCVLHQNLLRDRQHLREPAHCDVSGREPVSSQAHLQNLGRLRPIERESSAITYVNTLMPPPAPIERLTKFLQRDGHSSALPPLRGSIAAHTRLHSE